MKIFFSEAKPDYQNYIFPYAVWAVPEPGEDPHQLFDCGFLPSSRTLDRFYLCRQIRITAADFSPSSENRRIFKKNPGIQHRLVPKSEFDLDPGWEDFCCNYADIRFGKNVMTHDRLRGLFQAPIVSHVLCFYDNQGQRDVGLVMLYLEKKRMAYYYYAFYDLDYFRQSLGMFMMTSAVDSLARTGFERIYLGSCYSRNALYKTQFKGAEFFNGFRWSEDFNELKYLLSRDRSPAEDHLLEDREFLRLFYGDDLANIVDKDGFVLGHGGREATHARP